MNKKPIVFISKCIEHDNCRYDGNCIKSSFVNELKEYVTFVTECPEMAIGLGVPREAVRIISDGKNERLVYSLTGTDVTDRMIAFSSRYVNELKKEKMHGFILKSRSPSCGFKEVKAYKTIGKSMSLVNKTSGFFGKAILECFPGAAIEDEGRLRDYIIREHFLTRIFTMCSFDEVINDQTMKALVRFHSHNKYLLMAYNQKYQKILGKIVANHDNKAVFTVINQYHLTLQEALEKPLRRATNINMLMHLFGYFKNELTKDEKAYFLDVMEQYHTKKVPFSVPIAIIYSWVIRFDEEYLKYQTIFKPYPLGILNVSDSGKGID